MKHIDAQTLKGWLDADKAILIDVRQPFEYNSLHIPGARSVPLPDLTMASIGDTTGKKLVFNCRSGGRSVRACEHVLSLDPSLEIYNLEGGRKTWTKAGYGVKSSNKSTLPLDQQVQLTVGLGVLSGCLLGYLINPQFFLLSAFFGAGLTFAGLTGTCTLARILGNMPWNRP